MYLRVKKDSVTSILLFIFNVFLVERRIYSVPLKKIFRLLEPFHRSETSIRMGLSRGLQNGLFINERQEQEVFYRLTDEAVISFNYWQKTINRYMDKIKIQQANWNRSWSIILGNQHFTQKGVGNIEQFNASLVELGYGSLNKGHWISPYDESSEVIKLADSNSFRENILIFYGTLRDKSPNSLATEVWPINELAIKYKKYAFEMQESAYKLNSKLDPEHVLTFLYLYGSELFDIIQDDPQLPLEILPNEWPGLKAARDFWEIRQRVLPQANSFIDIIINE